MGEASFCHYKPWQITGHLIQNYPAICGLALRPWTTSFWDLWTNRGEHRHLCASLGLKQARAEASLESRVLVPHQHCVSPHLSLYMEVLDARKDGMASPSISIIWSNKMFNCLNWAISAAVKSTFYKLRLAGRWACVHSHALHVNIKAI